MAMKPIVTLPEKDGNQEAMWQSSQVSESVAAKYAHSKPSSVNSAEYKSHKWGNQLSTYLEELQALQYAVDLLSQY